jgi:hypothetical protein
MKLILSLFPFNSGEVVSKDKLLLIVDTQDERIKYIDLDIADTKDIICLKGLCYSGQYLMISARTNSSADRLIVIDIVSGKMSSSLMLKSKDIHDMFSVYRGRVYGVSTGTDSINNLVISPATNNLIKDTFHYKFDGTKSDDLHVNSLCNWTRRWYVSFFGHGWKDGDFENGAIIELTRNNRKVYSNINQPNTLFFNRNDELCFCESGKGLFHYGRSIVYVGGYPRGVIEDEIKNGYWIASSTLRNTLVNDTCLYFVNYDGVIEQKINLSDYSREVYSIVEAKGCLNMLL